MLVWSRDLRLYLHQKAAGMNWGYWLELQIEEHLSYWISTWKATNKINERNYALTAKSELFEQKAVI